jgi:hypothetical protein
VALVESQCTVTIDFQVLFFDYNFTVKSDALISSLTLKRELSLIALWLARISNMISLPQVYVSLMHHLLYTSIHVQNNVEQLELGGRVFSLVAPYYLFLGGGSLCLYT